MPQPVGPGARSRAGRRGGSAVALATGAGGARARHRHRRLDPHPRRVLRRLGPEADLQPDPDDRRLPARPLARPRRPDGAHARRRAPVLRGADRRTRARRRRRTRIAVCPDLHLHPLDARHPARVRHAVAALEATSSRSRFEEAERIYPAFVADPVAPRPRSPTPPRSRRAGTSTARTSRRASSARAPSRSRTYVEATATRERIRAGFARVFAAADLLLTPIARAAAGAARRRRAELPRRRAALHGPAGPRRPAVGAVPVGFDELGLPVGVQLTGPPWSEGRVLAAAEALFSATASARAGFASSR